MLCTVTYWTGGRGTRMDDEPGAVSASGGAFQAGGAADDAVNFTTAGSAASLGSSLTASRMASAAVVINVFLLAGMVLGLVGQSFIAYEFGATWRTDALFLSQDLSTFVFRILLSQQIPVVLLPLLVKERQQGDEAFLRAVGRAYGTISVVLVGFSAMVFAAAPLLANLYAPGFDVHAREAVTNLLRILLPGSLLVLLSGVATAAMHARQRFAVAAFGNVLPSAGFVLGAVILSESWGIYGPAAGVLIGSFAGVGIVVWGLGREGLRPRHLRVRFRDPLVLGVWRTASPFFVVYGLAQITVLVQKILASHLPEGSYSAMSYANRIYVSVTTLTLNTLQVVLYPRLSGEAAEGGPAAVARTITLTLRYLAFLLMPLVLFMAIHASEIVSLLFGGESFSPQARATTSGALVLYLAALAPVALYSVLYRALLSMSAVWWIVLAAGIGEVVQIVGYLILAPLLGVQGLVLASIIGSGAVAIGLRAGFARQLGDVRRRLVPLGATARYFVLAALSAGTSYGLTRALVFHGDSKITLVAQLAISALLCGVSYLSLTAIFCAEELARCRGIVVDMAGRRRRGGETP